MFTDVLIHGWDIAKATGQPTALDDGLLAECYALVQPREENYRKSAAFGGGNDV
jgi:hypothetical protein